MSSSIYSPPNTAEVGQKSVPAGEGIIKESMKCSVSWNFKYRDGIEFAVACLQLLSDKSHVSLNARPLVLYPLQVALLNFFEEWRRHHITSVRAVTAYLPVRFDYDICSKDAQPGPTHLRKITIQRVHVLEAPMRTLNLV